MSHNYRCTIKRRCGVRVSLPRLIDQYIRRPMCPECGKDTLKIDPAIKTQRKKWQLCKCDGLPWSGPHRKGGSVWCKHHPIGPTEEDYQNRYRSTPA